MKTLLQLSKEAAQMLGDLNSAYGADNVSELQNQLQQAIQHYEARLVTPDASKMASTHLTDEQMASKVRMLMRTDLDHEAVCVSGRDRILWLSHRVAQLEDQITSMKAPVIYVDDNGLVQSRVSIEQVEAVLGPHVDSLRLTLAWQGKMPARVAGWCEESSLTHNGEVITDAQATAMTLDAMNSGGPLPAFGAVQRTAIEVHDEPHAGDDLQGG